MIYLYNFFGFISDSFQNLANDHFRQAAASSYYAGRVFHYMIGSLEKMPILKIVVSSVDLMAQKAFNLWGAFLTLKASHRSTIDLASNPDFIDLESLNCIQQLQSEKALSASALESEFRKERINVLIPKLKSLSQPWERCLGKIQDIQQNIPKANFTSFQVISSLKYCYIQLLEQFPFLKQGLQTLRMEEEKKAVEELEKSWSQILSCREISLYPEECCTKLKESITRLQLIVNNINNKWTEIFDQHIEKTRKHLEEILPEYSDIHNYIRSLPAIDGLKWKNLEIHNWGMIGIEDLRLIDLFCYEKYIYNLCFLEAFLSFYSSLSQNLFKENIERIGDFIREELALFFSRFDEDKTLSFNVKEELIYIRDEMNTILASVCQLDHATKNSDFCFNLIKLDKIRQAMALQVYILQTYNFQAWVNLKKQNMSSLSDYKSKYPDKTVEDLYAIGLYHGERSRD